MAGNDDKVRIDVELDFSAKPLNTQSIDAQINQIKQKVNEAVNGGRGNMSAIAGSVLKEEAETLGEVLKTSRNKFGNVNAKELITKLNNNNISLETMTQKLKAVGVNGSNTFKTLLREAEDYNVEIAKSNHFMDNLMTTLGNNVRWNMANAAVSGVVSQISRATQFVKDMDTVLTDIRIVSGHSADHMRRFAKEAIESSEALKVSATSYGQAATLFFQQGLSDKDVKYMTDVSVKAARVTGMQTKEMSELLTATINGFDIAKDKAEQTADAMANLGAHSAADFQQIAIASSKVSSMAKTAGVASEELFSQIATIEEATKQAPESIGVALKTVYSRMLQFKVDSKNLLKDDAGEIFSAPEVEKALQAYSKFAGKQISLFKIQADGTKTVRNLNEVLNDVGNTWSKVGDRQAKFALTTAMAGTRQQNNLIALMDNWKRYQELLDVAHHSQGTLAKQNEIYLESYQGKLHGLRATLEEVYQNVFHAESFKNVLDVTTKVTKGVAKLTENMRVIPVILSAIGTTFTSNILNKLNEVKVRLSELHKMNLTSNEAMQIARLGKHGYTEEANKLASNISTSRGAIQALKEQSAEANRATKAMIKLQNVYNTFDNQALKNANYSKIYNAVDGATISDDIHEIEKLKSVYISLLKTKKDLFTLENAKNDFMTRNAGNEEAILIFEQKREQLKQTIMAYETDINKLLDNQALTEERINNELRQKQAEESAYMTQLEGVDSVLSRQVKTQARINTALVMIPASIGIATDKTIGWGQALTQIGTTIGSSILLNLMMSGQEIMAATAGASGLAAKLSTGAVAAGGLVASILPIVAIIGAATLGAKALNDYLHRAERAYADYSEAKDKVEATKSDYESINNELEQSKRHLQDIQRMKEDGEYHTTAERQRAEEDARLTQDKIKKLETEAQIKEHMLDISRQQEAIEARKSLKETSMPAQEGYKPSAESGVGSLESVSLPEHMELITESLRELQGEVDRTKEKTLEAQEKVSQSTGRTREKAMKDLEKAVNANEQAEEKYNDTYSKAGDIYEKLIDLRSSLDPSNESDSALIDNIDKVIEGFEELSGIDLESNLGSQLETVSDKVADLAATLGEDGLISEDQKNKLIDLSEQYEIVTNNIDLINEAMAQYQEQGYLTSDMLDKLNAAFGNQIDVNNLTMQSMQQVATAADKKKTRIGSAMKAELKSVASSVKEQIKNFALQAQAMGSLSTGIKGFIGKIPKSFEMEIPFFEKVKRTIKIAQDTQGKMPTGRQMLDSYGIGTLEEIRQTGTQKKKYSIISDADYNRLTSGADAGAQAAKDAENKIRSLIGEVNDSMNDGGGDGGGFVPSHNKKRGGGGHRKGGGGGKSKKEKLAEADAYAAVNAKLKENNQLLAANKERRSAVSEASVDYRLSLVEEKKLLEERQKLLHDKNKQMRAEGKQLQKELSGIFQYEGSLDDNTLVIKNMEAIQGKSQETEKKFKRLQQIIESLPEASNEWWKIQNNIDKIKLDDILFQFKMVNQEIDKFGAQVKELDYQLDISENPDEYSAKIENITKKIEIFDKEVKYIDYAIKHISIDAFPKGTKAAEDLKKAQDELNKKYKESKVTLAQYEREFKEMVKAEKQALKEKIVTERNAELEEQRKKIDAIDRTQEAIVSIIRKRGEEEQRLLDEQYNKDLERLDKKREDHRKANQDELDNFRKLIQDKIDALNEQYQEEDYAEQLAKEQRTAYDLQKRLSELSLDDSLIARNQKRDLRKQLADQREKIAKMERDHEREATRKALEDELKNYEDSITKKEEMADKELELNRKKLQDEYDAHKKMLDEKYSNAKVYAEAAEALVTGQVQTIEGAYISVEEAHRQFINEFGAGMGVLGDMIQNDFIEPLNQAQNAIKNLEVDLAHRPREDWKVDEITDEDLANAGWKEPTPPNKDYNVESGIGKHPAFWQWSDSDYDELIKLKRRYESATSQAEKDRYNMAAQKLRSKYFGSAPPEGFFSADELDSYRRKRKGYRNGGIINETGMFMGHGSEHSSEVVFSAKTAKKLWEYIEGLPQLNSSISAAGVRGISGGQMKVNNNYQIDFRVEGNMDRSLLPQVKAMISSAITEAEEKKIRELNKVGIFRAL